MRLLIGSLMALLLGACAIGLPDRSPPAEPKMQAEAPAQPAPAAQPVPEPTPKPM